MDNIKNFDKFEGDYYTSKEKSMIHIKPMEKPKTRPRNFDEFLEQTRKEELCEKYMKHMRQWVYENKTKNVLDKLPTDELEEVEELGKDSPIGSYITSSTVTNVYGDDLGEVVDDLTEKSVLVYYWDGNITLWNKKDDGLVRIK